MLDVYWEMHWYAIIAVAVAAWLLAYQISHWRELGLGFRGVVPRNLMLIVLSAAWPILVAVGVVLYLRDGEEDDD